MDYAINDREPTITLIKEKIRDVQKKIIAYKTTVNNRYNLAAGADALDTVNNVRVYGNDGNVTCNTYCHGKNGKSWNNELPADWLGAQCLSAGADNQYGCDAANVFDVEPTDFTTDEELMTTIYTGGELQCLCQRNDTFPYSSDLSGNNVAPDSLYNFNTGGNTVHQMTCGSDLTRKRISKQCFKDLWANAGCTEPLVIPDIGNFSVPGTSYMFDISNNMIDMNNAGVDLENLQQIIAEVPSASCGAKQSLSEMRNAITAELNEINKLIESTKEQHDGNMSVANHNASSLLHQFNQLQTTFLALQEKLKEPIKLDGNYESTTIQVASKFSNFFLVLLITIFFVGALCFIFINPEVGNLDMFMLVLVVIILVYYLYEYIQKRRRQ